MRAAVLALAAITACQATGADPAKEPMDPVRSVRVFAGESWYAARPEPETLRAGYLRRRPLPIGPGDRGGLDFDWVETEEELPVYAAGVERVLGQYVGIQGLRALARVVDLAAEGYGRELWIGSLEVPSDNSSGRAEPVGDYELGQSGQRTEIMTAAGWSVEFPTGWLGSSQPSARCGETDIDGAVVPAAWRCVSEDGAVAALDFETEADSFPIGGQLVGLHLSSYEIAGEGSMALAAGRDVFLVLDWAQRVIHPGLIDLGLTKGRHRGVGCMNAFVHHFYAADVDGDGFADLAVIQEAIRCGEHQDPAVHEFGEPRWYLFEDVRWILAGTHDGACVPVSARELPPIRLGSPIAIAMRSQRQTGEAPTASRDYFCD